MRILIGLAGLVFSYCVTGSAFASCGPDKLGLSRTITVDTSKFRKIYGTEKSFGLRPKEVILTFDDGPIAGKTSRILKTLKKECVKATFFYVGQMAKANPKLVRRVVADGHTLAHHTHNHNRLPNFSTDGAEKKIDQGISAIQKIAYGSSSATPRTPFFRYPYLASTKRTDRILASKGLIAIDANIDSLDWKLKSADKIHNRIMRRLRQDGKGIILMHDIHGRTAKMLPRLLRSLKDEGYKVVHMVPKGFVKPKPEAIVMAQAEEPTVKVDDVAQPPILKAKKTAEKRIAKADEPKKEPELVVAMVADLVEQTSYSAPAVSPKRVKFEQHASRTGVQVISTATVSRSASRANAKRAQLERKKKRRINKRKKKHSFVVLAGGKKRRTKGRVVAGGWKLRRSQWIIN